MNNLCDIVIKKKQLMSAFHATVQLLTYHGQCTLWIHLVFASWIRSCFDNVMTKFIIEKLIINIRRMKNGRQFVNFLIT